LLLNLRHRRYSEFIGAVEAGRVERVRFSKDGSQLQLTAVDGRRALVVLPNDPDLVDILARNGVDISVSEVRPELPCTPPLSQHLGVPRVSLALPLSSLRVTQPSDSKSTVANLCGRLELTRRILLDICRQKEQRLSCAGVLMLCTAAQRVGPAP
jgi:hypothetical protein